MRYTFENPFIDHECQQFDIPKAPLATNILETYGQCNEDLIVESLLRALMFQAGRSMESIRYLEIGANHPIQTSSTYLFYKVYGARGILVEAVPRLAETLRKVRPRDVVVNRAITVSEQPTVIFHIHEKNELSSVSLENISRFRDFGGTEKILESIVCANLHINAFLEKYSQGPIDYLSIDIEGLDAEVLETMDPEFKPSLIQCEHASQVAKFNRLLAGRGYKLIGITEVNALYARNGLF
jgi:FkbM family methyltransferase